MYTDNLTAHMVVRDEERFVWYSLMSVAPYVTRTIVFLDTNSKDQTATLVADVVKNVKGVEVHRRNPKDYRRFGLLRDEQIQMTTTPFFMVLDGDEVYPQESMQRMVNWTLQFPDDKNTMRVRCRWFIGNCKTVCDTSPPSPIRLYRTIWQERRCRCGGPHPGEMHHYEGETWKQMQFFYDPMTVMCHYSWIQKAKENRRKGRKAENIRTYTGAQPEVFSLPCPKQKLA